MPCPNSPAGRRPPAMGGEGHLQSGWLGRHDLHHTPCPASALTLSLNQRLAGLCIRNKNNEVQSITRLFTVIGTLLNGFYIVLAVYQVYSSLYTTPIFQVLSIWNLYTNHCMITIIHLFYWWQLYGQTFYDWTTSIEPYMGFMWVVLWVFYKYLYLKRGKVQSGSTLDLEWWESLNPKISSWLQTFLAPRRIYGWYMVGQMSTNKRLQILSD